ncbi:MAG: ParB/RepB/Spo0J family partition protein [Planctomycetota bacterium]
MPFGDSDDSGLGKSIADVLRKTPKSKEANRGFLEVDINTVIPPAENPRQVFRDEELQELADSIRIHGILQPLVVLKRSAGYEVLSGERRYRAARIADLERVPVVIRDIDDAQECAELRLIENIQRQDLNPIELAQAYQELIQQHELTQEELARRLGKSRSGIANCLRLLTLDDQVLAHIASEEISLGHAKVLMGVEDVARQRALVERIIDEGLSVRATEALIRIQADAPMADGQDRGQDRTKQSKPSHIRELEENLQRLFSARVKVREHKGRGSLTVYFDDSEAFQEIIGRMDQLLRRE